MRSVNGSWPEGTEDAQSLVDKVRGEDITAPLGARARVLGGVREKLPRRRMQILGRVAFGALATAALALFVTTRHPAVPPPLTGQAFAAAGERRAVEVRGDARLVLAADSAVAVVEDDASGLAFRLDRGSVLLDVRHRPAGAPLTVRTPRGLVRVVGTVLWVDVAKDGATTVLVGRGAVEVVPEGGAPVRVAAGERWPASSLRGPAPADLSLLASAQETRFAAPAVAAVPAPPPPPQNPCAGLGADASIACLEQLSATSNSLRAESALYEVGRRMLRDRGDARGAIATWERQRSRFPHGALRPEADLSILDALVRLGDGKRAKKALDRWLSAHPRSLAAPEAHYLRGKLERAAGHCPRAIRELNLALQSPADPWVNEARAELAACQSPHHRK